MAGHGDDDVPRPWDGKPPPHYSTAWDFQAQQYYEDPGPAEPEPRHRGPSRRSVAAITVAVLVVVGAGLTLLFTTGSGSGGGHRPAAAGSQRPATRRTQPATRTTQPTTSASPNPAAAYDVGSCFNEIAGSAPGKVELNLVPCGGPDSVFVINKVVASATRCDSGADYRDHGYEVPDETADVAYCASLVVPANSCFVLGGSVPIVRAACGSAPDAVQVLAIESAPGVATACTDKTNPDVWYYQAPTSGQFACVSRPTATPTTTTTTPTITTPAG
ncbi:MAG TPA: hypothetical protein VHV49_13295 [Pseudonocardiaceae bacterium]|nr:hypothetical protein [Pseudonocardiaceae bacterium]